jgi:hypothetical protein
MENSKYLKQCILILVISICLIILLINYSYKNKFNNSNIDNFEGFNTTSSTTTTNPITADITSDEVTRMGTLGNSLSDISLYKSNKFNDYNENTITNYEDVLKLTPEVFAFDNKTYALNFYQKLQDQEIKDLETNYDTLKNELNTLGLKKEIDTVNKIKHISTGTVFKIQGYNPKIANSGFNIILDNSKSMCLEFQSLDNEYIKTQPITTKLNNISKIPCDFGDMFNSSMSPLVIDMIKKQKFIPVKISNNTDYNNNLNSLYDAFKIPQDNNNTSGKPDFMNTLNNYPYYIIKPILDNNNMCLTITNNNISIEPCDGDDNQKFQLVNINY